VENLSAADPALNWSGLVKSKPGDQIWSFRSPPATWNQEMGTAGECLVRAGKIIDGYVTLVN
jgi:hypothetical protein